LAWLAAAAVWAPPAGAAAPPTEPLDVNEAVRIALGQNYGYRQSEAGVAAAEGSRMNAMAGLLPNATGSYSYSKTRSTTTLKDFELEVLFPGSQAPGQVVRRGDLLLDEDRSGNNLGLTVRQNLSFPLWYLYRSAQADVQGARAGREASAQELAFGVREQFYLVLRAQGLLQVQEEDLRLAQDQERRVQSMFELGSVARVDVLKSQVRVSDAEVALIRQQNTVEVERARLATLLGFPAGTDLTLAGNLETPAAAVDSAAAVREAAARPDLRQAALNVRSMNSLYKAAALSRLPGLFASFDVNASSGSSDTDQPVALGLKDVPDPGDSTVVVSAFPFKSDSEFDGWSFRAGAQVNLDAFLNSGEHKRAHAEKRRAEYALHGLELEAQRELEESILNLRASEKAIDAAERGVESAQEDLRLSQERYQQGLGTVLELLEAQVNLTRARNNLVNAQTGLKISEAALDRARGGALPF
jgi:outer membrane protein TolC